MKKIMLRLTFATIIVLANSLPAFALLGDTIGVGARAISMGEAFVAVADDYSATYYNPAGLGQIKDTVKFTMDWIYSAPQFKVTNLRTGGNLDQSEQSYWYPQGDLWDPVVSADGRDIDDINHNYPTIGVTLNITEICPVLKLPFNLTFGLAMMVPNSFHQVMVISDFIPDIPKFFRYGDMNEQLFIALSIGAEVIENRLYLGIGGQVGIYGTGDVHNNNAAVLLQDDPGVEDPQYLVFQMQEDWIVKAKLRPIYGILYTPTENIKIGASYKRYTEMAIGPSPVMMNYRTASGRDTGESMAWNGIMDLYFGFSPTEWSLGLAYLFDKFTVSADFELQEWSDFTWSFVYDSKYRHPTWAVNGYQPSPDFDDIVNIRMGMEYKRSEKLTITAGYQYMPTPIPDQSGRMTNYLDMDRNIFSLGTTYEIIKDFIKIGGVFQYSLCEDYTVNKYGADGVDGPTDEPGDDVIGVCWRDQASYKVEGDIYMLGISAEINF